ncbi:MAG: DUF3857 domain-containing protein [bacterium]
MNRHLLTACLLTALAGTAHAATPSPATSPPAASPPATSPPATSPIVWTPVPFEATAAEIRDAAARIAPTPDAPFTVLYAEQIVDLDPTGRTVVRMVTVQRVEQRRGVDALGTIGARWTPAFEERPTLRARVIDPAGAVHALDPAQLAEDASGALGPDRFTDARTIAGPLPRLTVGAIVETETVFASPRPTFQSGERLSLPLARRHAAAHHRVEWRVPEGTAATVAMVDTNLQPKLTTAEGRHIWRVDVQGEEVRALGEMISAEEIPADRPWDTFHAPRMVVGTAPSWGAAAREYDGIVEATLRDADVRALTADLPADARAAARVVSDRIHERARYTGVHFGRAAIIPRAPAAVLGDGFGDCKDLAVLFVAAMRHAGHDARVALVRANGPGVEASVPGLSAFDHTIARVGTDPPLWIDLTAPQLPPGELAPALYGRQALVIAPDTRGLTALPRPDAAENLHRVETTWRMGRDQPGKVTRVTEARGFPALLYRIDADGWPRVRQAFETATRKGYDAQSAAIRHMPDDRLAETLRFEVEVETPLAAYNEFESGVWYSLHDLFDHLPAAALADPNPEEPDEALRMHASHRTELVVRVIPPPGHVPVAEPPAGRHALGPAQLEITRADAPDGSITWTWRFDTGPRAWSAADLAAFRAALPAFFKPDQRALLHFEHRGHRAVADGRVAEGLRIYRELVPGGTPLEAVAYIEKLAEHGYPHYARVLGDRFVAEHPERGDGWQALGYARLMGLQGDILTAGSDREGGIAALERALALDAGLQWARRLLATAHAREGGVWAADPARRERGLGIARGGPGAEGVAAALAFSLDQPATVLDVLREPNTPEHHGLRFTARAQTIDVDAAYAELRRAVTDAGLRAKVLAYAWVFLAERRAYEHLRALSTRPELSGLSAAQRRVAQQLTRYAPPPRAADAPDALRVLVHGVLTDADAATLARSATPALAEAIADSPIPGWLDHMRGGFQRALTLPAPAATDALMAVTFEEVSRVTATVTLVRMVDGDQKITALVEQTADGHRVVAFPGLMPALFGQQLADALDRGDLEAAAMWRLWSVMGADPVPRPIAVYSDPGALAACITAADAAAPLGLTAAALLSRGATADRARAFLRAVREDARFAPPADGALAGCLTALDLALIEDVDARRARFAELAARHPSDEVIAFFHGHALLDADRDDEAEAWLARLDPALRGTAAERHIQLRLHLRRGRLAEYEALALPLLQTSERAFFGNNLGWHRIITGGDLAEAIAWLEGAREDGLGRSALHTLATLHGYAADPVKARAVLRESIDESGTIEREDWLVIGLIAEHEGLDDVARDAYRRLPVEAGDDATASSRLAFARLTRLDAGTISARK